MQHDEVKGSRAVLTAAALTYVAATAVAVMQLPVVQPYGIVGRGRYVTAPDTPKEMGWNYGAGVRLGVGRLGAFLEMRKHDPLKRTITTIGVTF